MRRRSLRTLCGSAAVSLLALAVVFTTAPTAQALAVSPGPVSIGTTLASVGTQFVATEEGAAGASVACGPGAPACLGLATAASVGMLAYDTRDLWLPVVDRWTNGFLSDDEASLANDTKIAYWPHSCSFATITWSTTVTDGFTPLDHYNGASSCTSPAYPAGHDIYPGLMYQATCGDGTTTGDNPTVASGSGTSLINTATGAYPPSGAPPPAGVYGYTATLTACGAAHGGVVSVRVWPATSNTGGTPWYFWGPAITITKPYPAAKNTQVTRVTCYNTQTQATTTISNTDVGQPGRVTIPSCRNQLGNGWIPRVIKSSSGPDATHQSNATTITDQTDWQGEYRDCLDGVGNPSCVVTVWVGGHPCTVGASGCVNWQRYAQTHPDDVKCEYGTHVVPIANCQALQHKFETGTTTTTVTTTRPDGTPDTGDTPGVDDTPDPSEGTDPTTGTGTGTGTFPSTGTNTDPTPVAPGDDPDPSFNACLGTGWSWNPVSWVAIPVRCTLVWAFKPPPGYLDDQAEQLRDQWTATAPGAYLGALSGLVTLPTGAGCAGVPLDVDLSHGIGVHQRLGAACEGDRLHDVAGVVKVALSAFIVIGGAFACARAVMAGLGISLALPGRSGGDST